MGKKLDLETLASILNPAIFVVLLGGLLLHFDITTLIIVGVVGYTIWGVLNVIVRRNRQMNLAEQQKKKKKGKVDPPKMVDKAFIASFVNPLVLIVLFIGIIQGWDVYLLVAIGAVGYGIWFILTMQDRKEKQYATASKKRKKR